MFDSIIGTDVPTPVKFVIAFAIVLGLIALAAWVARRVGGGRLGTTTARGRQPRLAVIDAAAVDSRRRLVLIRRDNVEHLVMIGGPTDVVVEQNIMRAVPVTQMREAASLRAAPAGEAGILSASELAEDDDTGQAPPDSEPTPRTAFAEPPPRPMRPEPAMRPPPPRMEPPPRPAPSRDSSPRDLSPRDSVPRDSMGREPALPRSNFDPARQSRPVNAPASPRPEPAAYGESAGGDHNLSDMANKLEAALRHAPGPPQPPLSPQPRRSDPPGGSAQKPADANLPVPAEHDATGAARAPAPAPQRRGADVPPGNPKTVFDSLEEEMASLLGRPNGKT